MANSASGDSLTDRLVRVLESFTPTRTSQSVSEIGRRAALPPSTAHRIVLDLVASGLLERDEVGQVRVGRRLWELATRSSSTLAMREVALPFMERVQARLREHTQLVVLEQDEALCVERLSSPGSGENITEIAGRLPLHAPSSGLVLLASAPEDVRVRVLAAPLRRLAPGTITDPARLVGELREIRARGYSVARGYVSPVSTGVAVPIRKGTGEVVAALSVVLPREANHEPALLELQSAARGIAKALISPK
jgi:DNA-binding IclR family transcriptional regulator